MNRANKMVREELKQRGVRHWELAHELGVEFARMLYNAANDIDDAEEDEG